jgi:predicted nuclease of predicted toxin-antitoxin system
MRWLVDECVDAALVTGLRDTGHDVVYVAESAASTGDAEILRLAQDQQRLLLTEDKDFGELVFRSRRPVPGLVLLRVDVAQSKLKWTRLSAAISAYGARLFGRYIVVEAARLRSRPLLKLA